MAFINEQNKEINCKIVYYGPPRCGKTTSLHYIAMAAQEKKAGDGDLISLSSEADHTLYFDFIPLSLGAVKGYKIHLHLYTIPGELAYQNARKLISKGVDGVIFMADSQLERLESNLASMVELKEMLEAEGIDWDSFPLVLQYNKRDLSNAIPVSELQPLLNPQKLPEFETVATKGVRVMETLKATASRVLKSLKT